MANIIITVAAKIFIDFLPTSLTLIRDENNSENITVDYNNGTGQVLTAGQELYVSGTPGQPGYIQILVQTPTIIDGSGTIELVVNSYPTSTVPDEQLVFQYDQSNITLNIDYNSRPENSDVNITLVNRGTHEFTTAEFVNQFTDYDVDTLSEIQINGVTTGYEYDLNNTNNYIPLVSGTWIPVNNIANIRYIALNQNPMYVNTNNYKVKDTNGLISN